ncbi:hypothetical protein B0H14DRAFT_3464107 [Mycena olivaceomarginata]|nr:hypothetical protein B0H14DRAFT_3464107 [Mycena olivaceomarginata]
MTVVNTQNVSDDNTILPTSVSALPLSHRVAPNASPPPSSPFSATSSSRHPCPWSSPSPSPSPRPSKPSSCPSPSFHIAPAPDGQPPLAFMMHAAAFVGAASVPMGLVCLGSALARLRVPCGSWDTLPVGAILVFIVGKFMHAFAQARGSVWIPLVKLCGPLEA